MASPEEFEEQMIRFGITAERRAVEATRMAFVAIGREIVTETPADTGQAKSNWLPGYDAPIEGVTIPAYVPGKLGSTAGENAEAAIGVIEGIAAVYNDPDKALYLTNNLPYIQKLNEGSSTQAPALFVEEAVSRGALVAETVRLLD